jgi:hypothetical protein
LIFAVEPRTLENKFQIGVSSLPQLILAIDDLCLFRMKFQSAVPQPFTDGRPHFLGFPLGPAVLDDFIGLPLKWHMRIVRRHPSIECVMQKQIGEQRAERCR